MTSKIDYDYDLFGFGVIAEPLQLIFFKHLSTIVWHKQHTPSDLSNCSFRNIKW